MAQLNATEKKKLKKFQEISRSTTEFLKPAQAKELNYLLDLKAGRVERKKPKLSKKALAKKAVKTVLNKFKKGKATIREVDEVLADAICALSKSDIERMCDKSAHKFKVLANPKPKPATSGNNKSDNNRRRR